MSDRKMIEGYLVEFKKHDTEYKDFQFFAPSVHPGRPPELLATTYHTIKFHTPRTGGQKSRTHYFFMPNDLPVDFMDIIQAEVNYQLRRMLEENQKRRFNNEVIQNIDKSRDD